MTNEHVKLSSPGPHYSCNNCCAWVSESKAITGDDNKGRFCGEECLEKWRDKQIKNEQEKNIAA